MAINTNKPAGEQILAAAKVELDRILTRLIACRNRQYREGGNCGDDLVFAIARIDFVLRDLMRGLVTPFEARPAAAKRNRRAFSDV